MNTNFVLYIQKKVYNGVCKWFISDVLLVFDYAAMYEY